MHFNIYSFSLLLIFGFAVLVFFILFYVPAPYGKFMRKGWGPSIKSSLAWMIMEFPSPFLMVYFFLTAEHRNIVHYLFIMLWLAHYLYRTFIYSFMQSGRKKPYPIVIVLMAIIFNILNGFANGYGVFHVYTYDINWIFSWEFISGFAVFFTGFVINKTADSKLMHMRNNNSGDYVIPRGWLFEYISSPHYFGEIVEWCGWALMTFSLPGLAFAFFTFANLFPRAIASHKWYKQHFEEYPSERKAIIPFLI